MSVVGQRERATQNRIVELFQTALGYTYLGDWHERVGNSNVEVDLLRANLHKRGYPDDHITKALQEFTRAAGNTTASLYEINKTVYRLLRYGVKFKPAVSETTVTVWLIDWDTPAANDFALAEEVTIAGKYTKRPDVVLYINGIAVGVLELKRSTVHVSEGIRQNLDNQSPEFIPGFFTTMQLVMAGNDTQGLRYGTILTGEKYYLSWKEDGQPKASLDDDLVRLCDKARLLELIHDFVIFDAGIKKLCRPNQYFGVKAAQQRLQQGEGGIIWHTQGSGKSLTMVWLSRWIREHYSTARILIITDRAELDEQIERIYHGVDEALYRTRSSADLIDCLTRPTPLVMASLIHKFPGKDEGSVEKFLDELNRSLPANFRPQGDFFVFVDECHRTQSGMLHRGMRALLPNAIFIGFTGTPLLKSDQQKQTSLETFGPYIHTYKYDEAVQDGVVLDLRYEARDIDQRLESPEEVDQWFAVKTRGLSDLAAAQLKQRWGTMQKITSAQPRLQRIVNDVIFDMAMRDRLLTGRGNALLVAGSIYEACKLYELFLQKGFTRCAIITSYNPNPASIKGEETGEGETEALEKYAIYQKMLNGKSVEDFERDVKQQFVEAPAQMKLLIVVDKLLTGFDAPPATYLYIDKHMRDHGLFQAICRVNRLDADDKEYGYIIDYKDLFRNLEQSITDYTSGAFDGFDRADVQGLLTDRITAGRERLETALEAVRLLCEPVKPPRSTQDYIRYFCGADTSDHAVLKQTEPRRVELYKCTVALIRAYAALAPELLTAGYTQAEAEALQLEVAHYEKVRTEIKIASGDAIDLKLYEPGMRQLLDTYIQADKSKKVSDFEKLTLIELIVQRGIGFIDALPEGIAGDRTAVAETIENNVRRVIIDENPTNPLYFARMSELLDLLIQQRKLNALEYEQYLAQIVELAQQVQNPATSAAYPPSIDSPAKQALFEYLSDEEKTLAVDRAIRTTKKHNWRGDFAKEREIMGAIYTQVNDHKLTDEIFKLIQAQREY